ncbi:MAG: DUF927 domain-containing protein [Chloroflexi bacterium]|nr:DUF927 domain-containing protein [Chloroflexota bacterium]
MTQNGTVNKTDTLDTPSAGRRDFLNALYTGSPDKLYLELRCIHPTTGEARSLWGRIGNKIELAAALKQAEILNHEGYGVYFAPCLRKTKQGKAEAAALAPALWVDVDCDGDAHQREQNLMKLRDFDPAPSFILDSGGGWHGYWLLDEPFQLQSDADRQKIAGILRGLFAALGGDPEYVKTVAGIMRLPDSVNTKPVRGGVVVTVVESHLERRYPLDTFAWLENQPHQSRFDGLKVVTLNVNGHHPLPSRTENYLASGTTDGSRNNELFAAACQLRDAGYSQSDTERELIPRHLTSGSSEREGLATIKSVYSRPAREPIAESRQTARQQVEQLVSRFGQQEMERERPTMEQISAAVTACAHLNAVEWAAERQRLKVLCGDGLKIADLDRLYREAKRTSDRNSFATLATEQYLIVDGSIVFEKQTERGINRQIVAGWIGRVLERTSRMDDDGQVEHLTSLELTCGEETLTLHVPSELFGDPNALQRFIAGYAGEIFTVRAGMIRHLAPAILALSGTYPRRKTYRFMGWTEIDGKWVYVSPEMSVSANGQLSEPPEVELESRLRDYRLRGADWQESLGAFKAAITTLPRHLAPSLIAFAMLPIVQRFFPAAATRPAVHLVGTSGSGKSEIASLLTSFYGQFTRDTPPGQWGDTINTVEALGYALADTLYWVDDYKTIYADERTFTRFLQSYSRGMGRGRLTREAKLRHERPCRGLLLSTGETTLEGEASILSRMLVLEIPPWEKRDPGGAALAKLEVVRYQLPCFTAKFIQWVAARADAGTLTKELASRFESNVKDYRDNLTSKLGRQANTGRMVQNWGVLVTTYQMLRQFMEELDGDDALPSWQDSIVETVKAVQQERAGQVFIDALGQLLASGELMLAKDMREPEEPRPGTTIVGYLDERYVYLLPDVAHRAVLRVQPLRFNTPAIGAQLKEDGWLIPGTNNLTVQRRIRGIPTRLWQLKADFLGCDDCDGGSVIA